MLAVPEDVCLFAFHPVIKEGGAIENILYSAVRNLK
jgi:hypothetical protein